MQIVLTENVQHLGRKGDLKNVKNGYFRNFLSPRGMAMRATPKLMEQLLERKKMAEKRRAQLFEKIDELKLALESMTLHFSKKATSKGKLYAAITEKQIQQAIEDQLKVHLEKDMVELDTAIKTVGEHEVRLNLAEGVSIPLKVEVSKES